MDEYTFHACILKKIDRLFFETGFYNIIIIILSVPYARQKLNEK